jgi:hypothetical protein
VRVAQCGMGTHKMIIAAVQFQVEPPVLSRVVGGPGATGKGRDAVAQGQGEAFDEGSWHQTRQTHRLEAVAETLPVAFASAGP